jgi:photosystem II stability/assembly factor-like uncharacterized protein
MSFFKSRLWARAGGVALLTMMLSAGTFCYGAVGHERVVSAAPPWLALYGVTVRPNGNVYIVGDKGLLLTSTDHGKTWDQRVLRERPGDVLFQDRGLYCIRFDPTGKSGWVVGEDGVVLHSDDGGKTWKRQDAGVNINLLKVAVIDVNTAVAVGGEGTILRTTDGGKTWSKFTYKHVIFFDVAFTDRNTGWAAGEFQTVLGTTDGGQTWKLVHGGNTTDFTIAPYFAISFSDPQHGVIAGLSGQALTTNDGGKTWQDEKLPQPLSTYVATREAGRLWLGGAGGKLLEQDADGKWAASRNTFNDITDMAFAGPIGYAVGLNGTILRTQNAGEQWQLVK